MDKNIDLQFARIDKIISAAKEKNDWDSCISCYYEYLKKHLEFPIEITGIEDFHWEEFYYLGPGSADEYQRLKKTQPSFQDIFTLKKISLPEWSEWMLHPNEDIGAHVIRKKTKKSLY